MKRRGIAACVVALMLAASMLVPTAAWAQGDGATEGAPASQSAAEGNAGPEAPETAPDSKQADGSTAYGEVTVSAEADAALMEGADFALGDFSRAQKGSNRDQDGVYSGYCYYMGSSADYAAAVATEGFVVVHVPQGAANLCDISSPDAQEQVRQYFIALDNAAMNGGILQALLAVLPHGLAAFTQALLQLAIGRGTFLPVLFSLVAVSLFLLVQKACPPKLGQMQQAAPQLVQ